MVGDGNHRFYFRINWRNAFKSFYIINKYKNMEQLTAEQRFYQLVLNLSLADRCKQGNERKIIARNRKINF